MARRRAQPARLAPVVAISGHENPEDAAKFIIEACRAPGGVRGVIYITVDETGIVDVNSAGTVLRDEFCWSALMLQRIAMGVSGEEV